MGYSKWVEACTMGNSICLLLLFSLLALGQRAKLRKSSKVAKMIGQRKKTSYKETGARHNMTQSLHVQNFNMGQTSREQLTKMGKARNA